MMKKQLLSASCAFALVLFVSSAYAQPSGNQPSATGPDIQPKPVIRIWPGKAPGTENWTYSEKVSEGRGGSKIYASVVDPTLTIFLPDPAKANGAAVIVCPGGGMRMVSISDRDSTAEWLNSKGITAFILKYRLVPVASSVGSRPSGPMGLGEELSFREILKRNGDANPSPDNPEHVKIIRMAIEDGQQAIRLLRRNAAEYNIDPTRIGIMGFSAGGGVAVGTALKESSDGYPNFVATVFGPSLTEVNVPKEGAPLFIAVMDGHFNVTNGCGVLFALWKEAGRPVEIHVYDHAYGPPNGMPISNWTDRLYEWFLARKIVSE